MQEFDLIFIGAGLVNSISYYFMSKLHPDKKYLLIEQGESIGGDHTWSFHAHEITEAAEKFAFEPSEVFQLLEPFISAQWSEYEVRFGDRSQIVPLGYCCMRSRQVHQAIMAQFSSGVILRAKAEIIDESTVSVAGLGEIRARSVIDGRGHRADSLGPTAFQKFYGLFVRLDKSTAWPRPVLMDATVEQDGDFRFIYVLPFDDGTVLVEDTRFSTSAALDKDSSHEFILSWLNLQGFDQVEILQDESGCLPIPLLGMRRAPNEDPWPVVGYRAGLFNASTGYSFSYALRTAMWLADEACSMKAGAIRHSLSKMAEAAWQDNEFNRRLNNMMIGAIAAEHRRDIFSRFYRALPPAIVARFYSGDLTVSDKIRILNIRPNIRWSKAFKSFVLPSHMPKSSAHTSMEEAR